MTPSSTDLLTAALALPDSERLALAQKLWNSVQPPNVPYADDADFAAEIERRCAAIDRGEVELLEHDEVMRRLRQARAAKDNP
jgi:putative addiction module component (TIGR02574 family)